MSDKEKHDSLRLGLIAVAVLLGSLAFAKVANSFIEPKRVRGLVVHASARNDQDPNRVRPYLDETKGVADALKAKNLFVKAPPPQHPVKQVDGILGAEVLIANKWYKVGDKIGEATIISVESTQVTIAWEGKEKAFAPIAAASKQAASKAPEPEKPKVAKEESAGPATEVKTEVVHVEEAPAEDDPLAWMGVDLPAGLRAKLLEKWNEASDEEKQQAREQWSRMSDEQKQQAVDQMEQHL
jgi:hypothetical protein